MNNLSGTLMDVFFGPGDVSEARTASRKRVYISGPITLGDREANVRQALEAHKRLLDLGYAPLNPMLSAWIPWEAEVPHEVWVQADLPWVEMSDALLRLPGESAGADEEVRHAIKMGIPFFASVEELHEFFNGV